jgi:hypothetical protein
VDRDLRVEYIDSLERADEGNLGDLARIFARLERAAILQALSVDADADISRQRSLTSAVLQSLKQKFGKRREEKDAELRQVNGVAKSLRAQAMQVLESATRDLKDAIAPINSTETKVIEGGADLGTGHWYKHEVVQTANDSGKYANFVEDHYFARATVRSGRERLVFVVSLHHVGRDLSGIMEATAFARLESFEESDERQLISQDFSLCSPEPFVFTFDTQPAVVADPFARWLDTALAVAVKEFGDRL